MMLIRWHQQLLPEREQRLIAIDPRVVYWPAAWAGGWGYNSCVPCEWWISFSTASRGLVWILEWSHQSYVIYTG